MPVAALVERLLQAKRDLSLSRELRKLDRIECLILDDIGYVQHDRAEMEVLFAPLPVRIQSQADREALWWGLLAWEDPRRADGPASPVLGRGADAGRRVGARSGAGAYALERLEELSSPARGPGPDAPHPADREPF